MLAKNADSGRGTCGCWLSPLATLGYGDVVAVDPWVRLFSPIQALTGFALLTAALSWFSQIYPALGRRRALSIRVRLLEEIGYPGNLGDVAASSGRRVLDEIAAGVIQCRVDLTQNTETYYFRETDSGMSLAASVSSLMKFSATARNSPVKEIRLGGELLQSALDDLAQHLTTQFSVAGNSTGEILTHFALDHGRAVENED